MRMAPPIAAQTPGIALPEQFFHQAMVRCVSAAFDANVTVDGNSEQR